MAPRQPRAAATVWAPVIALSAALALPSPASAQAGWTGVVTKISSRAGGGAQVAFDAAGNAMAVWPEDVGGGFNVVRAARYLRASGSWGAATNISDHGFYGNVRLAVNDVGDAIAAWAIPYDWDGFGGGGFAARYTAASAAWGAPTKLSDLPGSVEIAIDNFGNAISVWTLGTWSGPPDTKCQRVGAQ